MARLEKGMARVAFIAATKAKDSPIREKLEAGYPMLRVYKEHVEEWAA